MHDGSRKGGDAVPALASDYSHRAFGDTAAAFRLDPGVFRGALFGLVGPGGTGKMMTIRLRFHLHPSLHLSDDAPITDWAVH